MKLIIDIPEKAQKNIFKIRFLIGGKEDRILQQIIINAIKNGISLDDVKAEIRAEQEKYSHPLEIERAIEILDRIGKESEDK